jgi:hypothetical protein
MFRNVIFLCRPGLSDGSQCGHILHDFFPYEDALVSDAETLICARKKQ